MLLYRNSVSLHRVTKGTPRQRYKKDVRKTNFAS
nr:MAG TPA: hypothetical protein [Caudoviricetes sp.]DAU48844.1 MAG TPA: hypothetical protein [Caudoviricetes sp.]